MRLPKHSFFGTWDGGMRMGAGGPRGLRGRMGGTRTGADGSWGSAGMGNRWHAEAVGPDCAGPRHKERRANQADRQPGVVAVQTAQSNRLEGLLNRSVS